MTGMKALILYPMNALANDQAKRLADLLTTRDELAGITAALYTGQDGPQRTRVSADGLITDRAIIRDEAPDILLTNYKMLDQLLLRYDDRAIWRQSARSLAVPGARRVPHLRRRAGHRRGHAAAPPRPDAEELPARRRAHRRRARPPARPGHPRRHVGDPRRPGRPGGDDRLRAHRLRRRLRRDQRRHRVPARASTEWTAGAADRVAALGLTPRRPSRADLAGRERRRRGAAAGPARDRTFALLGALYDTGREHAR